MADEVLNQPPPFADVNLYTLDTSFVAAVRREGGDAARAAEPELAAFGARFGSAEVQAWAEQANRYTPVLRTHDRWGNRIDEVEYHPAYHAVLRLSVENGLATGPWRAPGPGAHVVRAAKMILASEVEYGHLCPVAMTYACVPALRRQPEVMAEWEPRLLAMRYDPRFIPAGGKDGVMIGMAMTEKQGGSDVRANITRAEPEGAPGPGREYRLTGHKWFCSAPMCDAFLVLAQTAGGLSCFLLPRLLPDGTRNGFHIQRLKDKLGNRSNASSEIELHGARARLVGEEGRGVPTIIEMANHTRLDCVLGSTGLMRQATLNAIHHTRHRAAFGRRLADQPLMQAVLADLWLESEAALLLALRLARSYDGQESGDPSRALRRIMTAVAKYWVCKRAPAHVFEALECHGGNGFVEESPLPRLYREAPLNSIWEGSGNVICLDVLRALSREPHTWEALRAELQLGLGADRRLDAFVADIERDRPRPDELERGARRFVERLARALQGSLLVRFAAAPVADGFCASRLGGEWSGAFGALPAGVDVPGIVGALP